MRFFDHIREACKKEVIEVIRLENELSVQDIYETSLTSPPPPGEGEKVICGGCPCTKWCTPETKNEKEGSGRPAYGRLLEVGVDDLAVDCLRGAMFLFAIEKVKGWPGHESEVLRQRFMQQWRKALDAEGWGIVEGEIKKRMKP